MKKFIYLFIYLLVYSCANKSEIPDFLVNSQYIEIGEENSAFYQPISLNTAREIKVKDNFTSLELMEIQTLEVNKIEKLNKNYKIFFKGNDWYYNIIPIDKDRMIYKWEYMYNSKTDEDFSYYTIKKSFLKILPQNKLVSDWKGIYSFDFGGTHMGEDFEGTVKFHVGDNIRVVFNDIDDEKLNITEVTASILELENEKGKKYKLDKDNAGNYTVSGQAIYMLSPPNESYLLTKEK